MARKSLPSASELRDILSYDPNTGLIFFKPRPVSMFPSSRLANAWNSRCAGKEACTTDRKGYRFGPILGVLMLAHRVAWALHYGEWPAEDIDHINQVKSDNRIINLRLATDSQNLRNIPMFSSNTSGYKGVSRAGASGKWVARISTGTEYKHLGTFATKELAAAAYISAAKYYHGEYFATKLIRGSDANS